MINLLVVGDDFFRHAVVHSLEHIEEIRAIECTDLEKVLDLCSQSKPDAVLMEVFSERVVALLNAIKQKNAGLKLIILTDSLEDVRFAFQAMKSGGDAILPKNIKSGELALAVKAVVAGMPVIHSDLFKGIVEQSECSAQEVCSTFSDGAAKLKMTDREKKIIKLIVTGKSNREIADELFLSEGRVRNIITGIYKKLKVKDRVHLAVYAVESRLIPSGLYREPAND